MSKIIFNPDYIEIRQYEFQVSNIRNSPIISIDQINEVNLNTFPPSFVINHNEVIFIETRYKIDFIKYVKEKKLKVNNRFDIWGAINEAFLDTEFTAQHQKRTLENLAANGVSQEEVEIIREEVKEIMQGWAAIAWEWNYLGHYDLLLNKKQSFLLLFPKEFYWWSMEIALRNYQAIE